MPNGRAWACWLAGVAITVPAAVAAPSTFGTIVGNALLCMDEVDNKYFYSYMATLFGPAYKHQGGAYWFKAEAILWNAPVIDVIVSDDTSALVFVGAVLDATPEQVEQAILAASGQHFKKVDATAHPVRESSPGSRIIYFDTKAKVYCAKYKPLPPGAR